MVTLLLISIAFSGIPTTRAQGVIKIGVIGPMEWIQGEGMVEGAQIAADKINAAGGILGNTVEIVSVDDVRGQPDATAITGQAAAEEMMTYSPDFVVGGFRTEAVLAERGVFMANHKIFFIAGASTDELIDDGAKDNPYDDVREDYNKYRFTFRVTPINSTMLFKSIAGFEKYTMISTIMPLYTGYASPLKIAVISEALSWTTTMHFFLTWEDWWNLPSVTLPSPPYPPGIVYPGMNMAPYGGVDVVYQAQPSATATDFTAELNAVKASEARILIHIISGTSGRTFIGQWDDLDVKAVPLGIDVLGQEIPTHWDVTAGKCQYEGFLATCGQRTPINAETVAFYDTTMSTYSHAPIYTSYGTYDAVIGIDEAIEAYGKWPMTGPDGASNTLDDGDEMVPLFEKTDRISSVGHFKYTGPHPMGSTTYGTYMATPTQSYLNINPTMAGTLHDVYSNELGPEWKQGFVRALFTQWQAGRLEVVYPVYSTLTPAPVRLPYAKIFMLPRLMFPYPTDIIEVPPNYGRVDIYDALTIVGTYGSTPGSPTWMAAADTNDDLVVNLLDALNVRTDFGKHIDLPLPYCSEGGRMHY
jgi:branched-chain amino acid transport system substrate-binding protein